MATTFLDLYPDIIAGGLVVGTHASAPLPPPLVWRHGGHPVPDQRNVRAATEALDLCRTLAPDDRLLVLISGGASALLCLPVPGLTLEDKQAVTRRLLAAGAPIDALNTVRKHLSQVKGGRLAQSCRAQVHAWLLSDVVGDDPSVIGSGPTVPDPSTFGEALAVLESHGGSAAYPRAVVRHLEAGARGEVEETPKPGTLPHVATRVIGSARRALDAGATAARRLGFDVIVRPDPVVGEAREAARDHLAWIARSVPAGSRAVCVLSCGETTVRVTGDGRGGRNQEFALAAALELERRRLAWCVASVGTDGVDGPTDAAGAVVDGTTASRARVQGVAPEPYLRENDAYTFFSRVGGHLHTGPTDTNVGDLQIVLIEPS
jgi:glycerate 2-kinase